MTNLRADQRKNRLVKTFRQQPPAREALEEIARVQDPRSAADAVRLIRVLRELAQAALADDSRHDRAA